LNLSRSNAGPQKCRCSRRNFVSISSRSWDISIFGLDAAILNYPLPVWSDSIWTSPIQMLDLKNVSLAVGILFSILSRSWDISISGLEAAILDFPLPVCFRLSPFFSWVTEYLKYTVFRWNRLSISSTSLFIDSKPFEPLSVQFGPKLRPVGWPRKRKKRKKADEGSHKTAIFHYHVGAPFRNRSSPNLLIL